MNDVVGVNELFDLMSNLEINLLESIISGLKKPIKSNIINLINKNVLPLLKNNFLKYFSLNLKNFINFLLTIDQNYIKNIITFLLKSWPVRYPDKLLIYIEIIENILLNHQKDNQNEYFKKVLRKIAISITNANFLVIFN